MSDGLRMCRSISKTTSLQLPFILVSSKMCTFCVICVAAVLVIKDRSTNRKRAVNNSLETFIYCFSITARCSVSAILLDLHLPSFDRTRRITNFRFTDVVWYW